MLKKGIATLLVALLVIMSLTAVIAVANDGISVCRYIMVDAGDSHTVALKSDGSVWTWGLNNHGQLGNGTNESKAAPQKVEGLSDVMAIAAGASQTVALKNDGTVWSWGQRYHKFSNF